MIMPLTEKKVNQKYRYYCFTILVVIMIFSYGRNVDAHLVRISGSLMGAEQKPIYQSHVVVSRFSGGMDHFLVQRVSSSGKFSFTVKNLKTFHVLFTGIYHDPIRVYFYAVGCSEIKLDVKLRRKNFHKNGLKMKILGNFNNFRISSGIPFKMVNRNEYTVSFPTKLKSIHYLIYNSHKYRKLSAGLSAGTEYESVVYRKRGYYTSIVTPKKGKITVKIRLSRWHRLPKGKMSLHFIGADKIKRFNDEFLRLQSFIERLESIRKKASFYHDQNVPFHLRFQKIGLNVISEIRKVEGDLNKENQLQILKLKLLKILAIKYKSGASINQILSKKICRYLPPSDPIWSFVRFPSLGLLFVEKGTFFGKCYQESNIQSIPDPYLKVKVIRSLFWKKRTKENIVNYKHILQGLLKEYNLNNKDPYLEKRIDRLIRMMTRFFIKKKIRTIPMSLQNKIKQVLKKKDHGKLTLLHVWATWCFACLGGIRRIRGLPDSIKNKINVVSISFDDDPQRIKRFQKKVSMPWKHLIESKGFRSSLAKLLSINRIPYMILLGKDGKTIIERHTFLQKGLTLRIQNHLNSK